MSRRLSDELTFSDLFPVRNHMQARFSNMVWASKALLGFGCWLCAPGANLAYARNFDGAGRMTNTPDVQRSTLSAEPGKVPCKQNLERS